MVLNDADSNPPSRPESTSSRNSSPPNRQAEALSFLHELKTVFASNMSIYYKFLTVLDEFKHQQIDSVDCLMRIGSLLRGHPNLINSFNTFAPPGFSLRASDRKVYVCKPNGVKEIPVNYDWSEAPAQVVPCLDPWTSLPWDNVFLSLVQQYLPYSVSSFCSLWVILLWCFSDWSRRAAFGYVLSVDSYKKKEKKTAILVDRCSSRIVFVCVCEKHSSTSFSVFHSRLFDLCFEPFSSEHQYICSIFLEMQYKRRLSIICVF